MKRVNLRLILVHSIAAWLLIYATELFGYLRDIPFLKVLLKGDYNGTVQYITSRGMTASEVIDYAWFVDLIWIAGFLLSLFISLYVGRKRHWWWGNSVIAVVVACIVNFAIGRFYHGENWIWRVYNFLFPVSVGSYIGAGVLCVIGSYFLFFSRWTLIGTKSVFKK